MKTMSDDECRRWLDSQPGGGFFRRVDERKYGRELAFALPADTPVKTALARWISGQVNRKEPALLWITAWGVFPSAENLALFYGYRASLGEPRLLHEASAHLLFEDDREQLEALLALSLYFLWDVILLDLTDRLVIRTSHDEWLSFATEDATRLAEIERTLKARGYRPL